MSQELFLCKRTQGFYFWCCICCFSAAKTIFKTDVLKTVQAQFMNEQDPSDLSGAQTVWTYHHQRLLWILAPGMAEHFVLQISLGFSDAFKHLGSTLQESVSAQSMQKILNSHLDMRLAEVESLRNTAYLLCRSIHICF